MPAKLVTSASIKDVEKNYFEADLSMFGGNSGSPIFDRISKKVIGILFQGIGPDYHLVCNYEGLGQHRIKARHATKENIKEIGYEKCQYISTIKVHLTQRIVWLKLQEISEDIECSNFKAAGYKNFLEQELTSLKEERNFCRVVAFIPLATVQSIYRLVKITDEINKLSEIILKLTQTVNQYREYNVNFLEAYHLILMNNNNKSPIEKVRIARNYTVYEQLPPIDFIDNKEIKVETLIETLTELELKIYGVKGNRFEEIEKSFEKRFPTGSIVKLVNYELAQGLTFAKKTRERILTYMHNEYENPEQSVAKARAKACYKTTKHESLYENFPKNDLKKISLYMVEKSPRLTFEQAFDELGYNRPQTN